MRATEGPYGKLRKWINEEMERSRDKAKVTRREVFRVPKQGSRQVAVVGPPNAGKSALLKALSGAQVKVAGYPFATLKPQAAIADVLGARVEFVEIPGLLPGANEDKGGGRALLAAIRNADVILYVASLGQEAAGLDDLGAIRLEVQAGGIAKATALCLTGLDLPGAREAAGRVVACSTLTGEGLDRLKETVWSMCVLIRVWRRGARGRGDQPFVLEAGATVGDLARAVHKDLEARLSRPWSGAPRPSSPARRSVAGMRWPTATRLS